MKSVVNTAKAALLKPARKDDTVQVYGVRKDNGRLEYIGDARTPPEMKMREIARQYFSGRDFDDGEAGDMCLVAMEEFYKWLKEGK